MVNIQIKLIFIFKYKKFFFSKFSKESFIEDNAKQLAELLAPDDLNNIRQAPIPGKGLFNY